jgi:MFS family permease
VQAETTSAGTVGHPSPRRAVAAAAAALATAVVPLFLVAALSGPIGAELGFGSAGTGGTIAVFFVAAGVSAVPAGWITNRVGAPAALRAGVTISGLAGLAVAGLAQSWAHLMALLAVAGTAIGFVDTAASSWFAAAVRPERQGSAFGLKEASIPAASLLAGLSIPLVADHLGWRATFVLGALLTPLVWWGVPGRAPSPVVRTVAAGSAVRWGPLVVFAAGLALGTGSAAAAATFLVPAFEDAGWSPGTAGVMLAAASSVSIAGRLALGRLSDRRPGATARYVVGAMAVGSLGAAGLALSTGGPGAVVAALVVMGAGWGWTGVAYHTMLRATLEAPAIGAGVVLTGLSIGGAAGPLGFGLLLSRASYPVAWAAVAVGLVLASCLTAGSTRWQARATRQGGPAPTRLPAAP